MAETGEAPGLTSFPAGAAVILGASGGIGNALAELLERSAGFSTVEKFSRKSEPPVDILDEASLANAAALISSRGAGLRLLIIATGVLHGHDLRPEKSLREISPDAFAKSFAINAAGPALAIKHFAPLLPPQGKSLILALSARVGSIGDNHLGGWYAYRAAKAALNQIVRTAAIEIARRKPEAICIAMHPGTVATSLTQPFAKNGLDVQSPQTAAAKILQAIDAMGPAQTGGFYDNRGEAIAW